MATYVRDNQYHLQRLDDDGGTTLACLLLPAKDTDREDGATKASTHEMPMNRVERMVATRMFDDVAELLMMISSLFRMNNYVAGLYCAVVHHHSPQRQH